MHFARSRAAVILLALLGLQLSAVHGSALAATEVRQHPGGIQLSATDATVKEVLDTLAISYKLTYSIPASLHGKLTVRCSGTLRHILKHALDGHDYFLKALDDSIQVIILEASDAAIVPGTAPVARTAPVATSGPVITASNTTNTPAPDGAAPASGPVLPAAKSAPPLASYLHQEPAAPSKP
jgi:hypothetical protein